MDIGGGCGHFIGFMIEEDERPFRKCEKCLNTLFEVNKFVDTKADFDLSFRYQPDKKGYRVALEKK